MTPGPARDGRLWAAALAVTAVAVLLVAYPLRYILIPFVVAGGLAFATGPAVRWLKRRLRLPHAVAVVAVFAPVSAACGSLAYWLLTALVRQATEAAADLPRVLAGLLRDVLGLDAARAEATAREIAQRAPLALPSEGAPEVFAGAALGLLVGGVLTFVPYFYFPYDGEKLGRGALWLIPPAGRDRAAATALRVRPVLRRYFVGLVVIVAFTSGASWLAIGPVQGIPDAALLAVVTGLLELVPVIGPIASAALVSGAALERGGVPLLLGFLVFYIILRLLIDQIVGPLVLGRAVWLHPVVVLFAFLVGGALFGMLGVLLAVPVAASIKVVLAALYEPEEKKREQKEAAGVTPPA
jgi:predicted PurR-regulated permease PerM